MAQLKLHIVPAWLGLLKLAHTLVRFFTWWKLLCLFVITPHVYLGRQMADAGSNPGHSAIIHMHSWPFQEDWRSIVEWNWNFFPYVIGKTQNKYLELKKLVGLPPQHDSNYLLSSFASKDPTTYQNNAATYRKHEHTLFHSGLGTQTHCALISPSLNPPHLWLYQIIWLVMHNILPSHIVFLCFKTQTQYRMQWHTHRQVIGTQWQVFSQGRKNLSTNSVLICCPDTHKFSTNVVVVNMRKMLFKPIKHKSWHVTVALMSLHVAFLSVWSTLF